MPVASGTKLGPYEILALLGAGGMGEVYRARDTKLKRDVALKILPEAFARDPGRMARFQREAEVLASLNHPNIAQIYGVEEGALVMELVDGDSPKGPMPFDEAWKIAQQMADALEYAHERGVVHRDLKPANVKVTPEGVVKLLDFGLAKAFRGQSGEASSDPQNSPTVTLGATVAGTIVGTAAYMAPEQARGKKVDKRADIWSWGVVLYELLTGERMFQGEDTAETLAAVIHKQPELERVPAKVRRLLRRCWEKDPKQRLRDIGAARELLEEPATAQTAAPVARSRGVLPWAVAAVVLGLTAAGLAFVHLREQPEERQVLQYTVAAPEKAPNVSYLALSPDGHYLAMAASGDGGSQIWLRSLDSLQTRALAGTEDAAFPFWSPDSRYIAFFAQDKLKKIPVNGGPPQTLCDAPLPRGGAWSREGVIVFAPRNGIGGLSRVREAGGVPVNITQVPSGWHRFPMFLPDGKRFLYTAALGSANGIYLTSLDDPKRGRRLAPDVANPQYLAPVPGSGVGHLLFVREGSLMAQPVDPRTMANKGELFLVAQQISIPPNVLGMNLYSISATGVMVYLNGGVVGGATRQHVWLDRAGKELEKVGGPMRSQRNFALSPDGNRLALERIAGGLNSDLWITDMEHDGREMRITFDASPNHSPVWSPDGGKVAFGSQRNGGITNLYQRASNGTGQDELLFESKDPNKAPWDWSRDGRFILFNVADSKTREDLCALPVTGQGDKKPFVVRSSPFSETQAQLSPDGRWLAYTSIESANNHVYVAPFTPGLDKPISGKWQISLAGGTQPRWRGDGKELYYVAPDRKLMAVEVKATAVNFERGTPQPLFELRSSVNANEAAFLWGYTPSADGKHFLVAEIAGTSGNVPPPMTVVVNWLGSVKN